MRPAFGTRNSEHLKSTRNLWRILLALLLLVVAALALRTDWKHAFSTDIFDLLDSDAAMDAETRQAQEVLRTRLSREVVMAVLPGEAVLPDGFRKAFLETAVQLPSFASVASMDSMQLDTEWTSLWFEHRIELLFPLWLTQHLPAASSVNAEQMNALTDAIVQRLDAFLSQPESMAYEAMLPKDPLLLLPRVMDVLAQPAAVQQHTRALAFSAKLASHPTADGVQDQLLADLDMLQLWTTQQLGSQAQLLDTGFHRYAMESKSGIQSEIFRLNLLSLALTLTIAFLFLRKLILLIPVVCVVLSSVSCALVVSLQLLGTLHILALVIGSILVGVAVDYGFHILFKREELGATSFRVTLRQIRLPLATSCLSTVFGFLVLLGNPVSAIQQVGVFVSLGLGFAMGISVLAALAFDFHGEVHWSRRLGYTMPLPSHPAWKAVRWVVAVACLCLYLTLSTHRDSIEDLQIELTQAPRQDAALRSLLGQEVGTRYWITLGNSLQQVIDRQAELQTSVEGGENAAKLFHLANILPDSRALQGFLNFRNLHADAFEQSLRRSMELGGYDPDAFDAFWQSWHRTMNASTGPEAWEDRYRELARTLPYPLDFLVNGSDGSYWGTTRVKSAVPVPFESAEHSFELAPLKALNRAFQSYRVGVAGSLQISLIVISAAVLLVFGPRQALRILQVPVHAVLATLAMFSLIGEAITLFHLIGLLLGICLTLDYAIFAAKRSGASPISIRASAITTMASFGALSLSHIPAVADLGTTVLCIACIGLLHTEWNLRLYHEPNA